MKTLTVRQRPRAAKQKFQGAIYLRKDMVGKRVVVLTAQEYNMRMIKISAIKRDYECVLRILKTDIRECLRGV